LSGGAIQNGNYVASEEVHYAATCSPASFGEAMQVCGNTMQLLKFDNGTTSSADATFSTDGNQLTLTITCGSHGEKVPYTFAATADEIQVLAAGDSKVVRFKRK
jgi:hypothetical protein